MKGDDIMKRKKERVWDLTANNAAILFSLG